VFYGVFTVEEFGREGDKGSGDTTMVDVQTLQEAFLEMVLNCVCFTGEGFFFFWFGKK
jgi:hypothetical protein